MPNDTDIAALIERLRDWDRLTVADAISAADALEACQARIQTHEKVLSLALDRAEKAEAALRKSEETPA